MFTLRASTASYTTNHEPSTLFFYSASLIPSRPFTFIAFISNFPTRSCCIRVWQLKQEMHVSGVVKKWRWRRNFEGMIVNQIFLNANHVSKHFRETNSQLLYLQNLFRSSFRCSLSRWKRALHSDLYSFMAGYWVGCESTNDCMVAYLCELFGVICRVIKMQEKSRENKNLDKNQLKYQY